MARTPDRFPGEREEDVGIKLVSQVVEPQTAGEIRNVNGEVHIKDSLGVFNPRTGGSVIGIEHMLLTTGGGVIYSTAGSLIIKAVA